MSASFDVGRDRDVPCSLMAPEVDGPWLSHCSFENQVLLIACYLQEDIDSFPSRWMVSDAGPAFITGILAPNITFLSSFRQST